MSSDLYDLEALFMVCSDLAEVTHMIPRVEVEVVEEEDFVEGIVEGLEDFAKGHCTHFKNADELIAHLRSL